MALLDVLEGSPIPVAILEQETGKRLFVNSALVEMFSLGTRDELFNSDLADTWVNQDDLNHAMSVFRNNQKKVDIESEHQHQDGSQCWVLMNTQILEFDGKKTGIIWHIDISEKKIIKAELNKNQKVWRPLPIIYQSLSPLGISMDAIYL